MKLPHHEQAIVPESKIVAYLLSRSHEDGRSKAVFFSGFGFTAARWEEFANALKQHARANEVVEIDNTEFGTAYAVVGPLETPDGRAPIVRVVWFIDTGGTIPRLVTAYPQKGAREDGTRA